MIEGCQPPSRQKIVGCLLWVLAHGGVEVAASPLTGYRQPSQELVDFIDSAEVPESKLSPDRRWLLLMQRRSLTSIAELAEEELRLGGIRFNPASYAASRRRSYSSMTLVRTADGHRLSILDLPQQPRLDAVSFSPDSSLLSFTHTREDRVELWVAEVATGQARPVSEKPLNLSTWIHPRWLSDSRALVANFLPLGSGRSSLPPELPTGPLVRESDGTQAPTRTYQDLLQNPHDEMLFEHYLTGQLAVVRLDGEIRPLGEPRLIVDYDPSPDGSYVRVVVLKRPFSYLVPAWRFPRRVEVWGLESDGEWVIADLPLRDDVPIAFGSVAKGRRRIGWREDSPATLVWAEALDGGDASRESEYRDRLFLWPAPFTGKPLAWIKLQYRFAGVRWGNDRLALVSESWPKTRRERLWRVRPGSLERPAELLVDRNLEDRYHDPGRPVTTTDSRGRSVLDIGRGGGAIYFIGDGASPSGDRPFLDVLDLEKGESRRLFHSAAPYYESPKALLGSLGPTILTRRESPEQAPNFFVRDLKSPSSIRQLTSLEPSIELSGFHKEIIHYSREDGVALTATLYLPPGFEVGTDDPPPLLMWAYPREFQSVANAGQVRGSPHRYDRMTWRSPLLWLTQGYAVLDEVAMPIIGEGKNEPNDEFVEQLVMNARAAVEACVRRGVASTDRIAIGGHSYGAFMTANLLAHTDLFAAGIARSGAYNRTLTPFGFQFEERTLWDSPEVYFSMSPFMHAEKIEEPLLLVHGAADNNSGTYPMQSERFFDALKANSVVARLVILPHESHDYRARESVLHVLWETERWLERYVKKSSRRQARGRSTARSADRP